MRTIIIGVLLVLTLSCHSQELQYRSVESYFDQIAELELSELIKQEVLIDSITISDKYLDKKTERLNDEGFGKYANIKLNIYLSIFKDYLYQQHLIYKNNVYVLYFSMGGFDDTEWNVVKWTKEKWKNEDKLNPERLKSDTDLNKIFGNYDEGPKNLENIKIFIRNDYLVLERGNLYHSLYDLKIDKLLLNEESPWHASNGSDKEKMNEWIKINIHDKIVAKLKEERN